MDDLNAKILWDGYGLRFQQGKRTRTGLICKTDKGLRELKKARTTRRGICFAHDVKETLYHNGFKNISRFYETQDGQPCFNKDGVVYVLEEVLPEATLEEDCEEAFYTGARTLGKLHRCGRGIESQFADWDLERLPLQYQKRQTELAKIRRRIQKQGSYDAIDIMVMENYEAFMEQTAYARGLLEDADYIRQADKAKGEACFCHGSFKGERLRLGDGGKIFVSGFENCTSDVQLLDLASYLKRYMKKLEGTQQGAVGILLAYQEELPLSEEEKMLLRALIAYPEKFLRLMNEYYNRRKSCVSPAMQERLASAILEEEKTRILLNYIEKA